MGFRGFGWDCKGVARGVQGVRLGQQGRSQGVQGVRLGLQGRSQWGSGGSVEPGPYLCFEVHGLFAFTLSGGWRCSMRKHQEAFFVPPRLALAS